jgi:carbamoyltransferase
VKGEPIVETPHDAVVCFMTTGADHLVLHDTLISKNALHKVLGPLVGIYSEVATMVVSNLKP